MEVMFAAPSPVLQTLQDPGVVPIYLGCPRSYPGHAPEFLLVVSAGPSHAEAGGGARSVCAAPVGHTSRAVRGMARLAQPHAVRDHTQTGAESPGGLSTDICHPCPTMPRTGPAHLPGVC